MAPALSLSHVSAHYGATRILDDLSLHVDGGELVSLLGASGCGKTTTLRVIAGFLPATTGTITLGGTDLTRLPAHRRNIGIVFQNYALFPHLTVRDNVAFGLKQRGMVAATRAREAAEILKIVGLADFSDRFPAALSGGQRQRVALARALVVRPPLLMFDEPLSNLDAKLRIDMRVEIRQLQQSNGTTAVFVTHDQEEAFSISDRVAIMDSGRIHQFDTPETLYQRPADPFVARFVGFVNLVSLQVSQRNGAIVTTQGPGGYRLLLDQDRLGPIPDRFMLAARPDGLRISDADIDEGIPATVGIRTYLGRTYHYQVETASGPLTAAGSLSDPLGAGHHVRLIPDLDQCCILPDKEST